MKKGCILIVFVCFKARLIKEGTLQPLMSLWRITWTFQPPFGSFPAFVTASEDHMSSPAPHHLSTPTPPSGIHSVFSLCFRWRWTNSRKISIMPFNLVNSILQNMLSWEHLMIIFLEGTGNCLVAIYLC